MRSFFTVLIILSVHQLFAQEVKLNIHVYELSNGLKVYLNEDRNASNVYGSVWVNAGGKNDPADATGIAHYLEHMLFKGTEELGTQDYSLEKPHLDSIKVLYDRLAITDDKDEKLRIQKSINEQELKASQYAIPNEFDRLIKSIGSTGVNAGTSNDYTYYYNYFPAEQLPKWLNIYAHRFQKPVFRLFQSELEAVYEEKNRAGDDLERRVGEKFNEFIYGDQPYSTQTVLGSIEHLKSPSLTKMYKYFTDYYVASNMALVICGNFDAEKIKPLIEDSFGVLERGNSPSFPSYPKNSFSGRVVEKVRITPVKAGFMGYKLVPEGHPDQPALKIVGEMMSNYDQTGFLDELSLNNEVLFAGGYQEFLEEDGSTFIFYVPKIFGKSLKNFEKRISGNFADIANGNFTDEYFESIKNGLYRSYNLAYEELGSRGRYLGLSFVYGLDYKDMFAYPSKIKALTKEEVQAAAAKYYSTNYFTLQSRTGFPKKPKLEKPPYKPISARTESTSEYAKRFKALEELEPDPQFIDLQKDLHIVDDYLYYTQNPLNDIFTLNLSIAGGLTKDNKYPLLAATLNSAGTTEYSAAELKKKFASLGASYEFAADYNSFEITITGLDDNFKETLSLLEHVFSSFNPTEESIKYLANQRTTDNKLSKNNPSTGGRILYSYGLFDDKSSYKTRLPIKELKNVNPSMLKTKLNELTANGFNSIHYVGQLDEDVVVDYFKSKAMYKNNVTDSYTFLEARAVDETTFYIVNDKKAIQSYVYYIVNGEPLNYEEDYKKEAFNAYYTNSLSGLLFQEVREFRSLAYSTGGNYIDPIYEPNKKGRLVLFTGSQADKTTDAVVTVMDLLNNMPAYETRVPSISEGLVLTAGSSKPSFRSMSRTVDTFLKTGYSKDPNQINFNLFKGLEFKHIQSFYEDNIKGKPAVITIYGDASKFDLDQLRKLGKVVELKMEDILVE